MYALNSGGDYQAAGPLHLAGDASSWRTPLAKDIRSFEQFQVLCIMHTHVCTITLMYMYHTNKQKYTPDSTILYYTMLYYTILCYTILPTLALTLTYMKWAKVIQWNTFLDNSHMIWHLNNEPMIVLLTCGGYIWGQLHPYHSTDRAASKLTCYSHPWLGKLPCNNTHIEAQCMLVENCMKLEAVHAEMKSLSLAAMMPQLPWTIKIAYLLAVHSMTAPRAYLVWRTIKLMLIHVTKVIYVRTS